MQNKIKLFKYQSQWANDPSRWKFGLMSRQVGKDFASGYEGIRHCLKYEMKKDKTDWVIVAPSERQSLESLQKWRFWAEEFGLAIADYVEERDGGSEGMLTAASLIFPHGSRVISLPGKPGTARGFCANVLISEFNFLEQPAETLRAFMPMLLNPIQGGVKMMRIITSASGFGGLGHDLWQKNYRPMVNGQWTMDHERQFPAVNYQLSTVHAPLWSCHLVDIYRAVADGLPLDIEEFRAAMNDPEGWAQEFQCHFLDTQSTLLPYDLIAPCESKEARAVCPPEFWQSRPVFPLVMGLDFGRSRDLTAAWVLARLGDVWQTMEVLVLEKTPTDQQVDLLRRRIQQCGRVCLDYTGPGVGLGDYLVKEFRLYAPEKHQFGKIELCHFTHPLKVDIFSKLRMAFENRSVRVPSNREIREDLHSVNRVCTTTGQITYRAPHSPDGHADRCTALALALRAAADGPVRCSIESVPRRPGLYDLGVSCGNRRRFPL